MPLATADVRSHGSAMSFSELLPCTKEMPTNLETYGSECVYFFKHAGKIPL